MIKKSAFIKFFLRDLWVGVYIGEKCSDSVGYYRTIYFCPVPAIVCGFDLRVR